MSEQQQREQVVLELEGSEAARGLPLHNLEQFIDQFIRGLRAFDRVRRAQPALKAGQPGRRGEAVSAFRVVELRPGSAILTLEPIVDEDAPAEMFPGQGTLAISNLDALLDAIEEPSTAFDPDVVDALAAARRSLGSDGKIRVVRPESARHTPRSVLVDERRVTQLRERARQRGVRTIRLSGRLHMIDVEPPVKVGIRSSDGVEWICRYPESLEPRVKALLDENVWVRGRGVLTGAQRGSLEVEEIRPVGEYPQSPLFTFARVPLDELMADQGVRGPQGHVSLVPADVSDEELDSFLDAVLNE